MLIQSKGSPKFFLVGLVAGQFLSGHNVSESLMVGNNCNWVLSSFKCIANSLKFNYINTEFPISMSLSHIRNLCFLKKSTMGYSYLVCRVDMTSEMKSLDAVAFMTDFNSGL
jgi:hypothetical protein